MGRWQGGNLMPHYFCNKTTTVTLSHARRVLIIRNMLHIMPKNRANRHNHKVIHEFELNWLS